MGVRGEGGERLAGSPLWIADLLEVDFEFSPRRLSNIIAHFQEATCYPTQPSRLNLGAQSAALKGDNLFLVRRLGQNSQPSHPRSWGVLPLVYRRELEQIAAALVAGKRMAVEEEAEAESRSLMYCLPWRSIIQAAEQFLSRLEFPSVSSVP